MFGGSSAGITLKKTLQSGTPDPTDFDIALLDFLPASPVWQVDRNGKKTQYDPFETFAAVEPATRESWILRTGFFLEYVYDLRFKAMISHAMATNQPAPSAPPTFLMGAFGQKLHTAYAPLRMKYLRDIKFTHGMPPPLHIVHPMAIQMKHRFEALLPSTIDASSAALTALAASLGMLPVTILQNYFEDHADLCALRRQILSQASKDRLASIGLSLIQAQQGSSSASKGTVTHDLKELISIGTDVTLAGGVAAVGHLPLADIRARALEARCKGGRKGMTDEKRRAARRASGASRTGRATSRFETMFERLRTLQGETTSLPQVVTTWFESTLSDLEKVTGPTARSKALRALGILRDRDYKDFNRLFKKSGGYEKAPVTMDPALKAVHKAKHLQEIMKFIKEHPLPSQKKRKVVGKKGEEERLLTVLWYDQQSKAARKLTGDLDDSD
jgi:hypothetical protein